MSGFEKNIGVSRWRNHPVSRRPSRRPDRRSPLLFFLLGGFTFVGLLCLICRQKDQMVEHGYQIEACKKETTQLEEIHNRLKLEYASLLTPSRINRLAQEQLGMATPIPGQILFDSDIPNSEDYNGLTASVDAGRKVGLEVNTLLQPE